MHALRFIVILFSLSGLLQAQHGNFKKPLTAEDFVFLKKEATDCFGFNAHMQMSYNNLDFINDKHRTGDKPATAENIELVKKQLAKDSDNVGLYTELTNLYSRMQMPDEAREYRRQSFDVISKVLKAHPDSANALTILGGIYMSALQMDSALAKYRQALALDPLNKDAIRLIPFMHVLNNHFDSAYAFILKQTTKYPDNYTIYETLPVYYIYKFYDQLNKYNQLTTVDEERLKPENIITLKLLKDYADRDKSDFNREYLYRVTYQVCYSTLITYKTVNDSMFNVKQIRFVTTLKDAAALKGQQEFFTKCLKAKIPENKYLANKILGNINLLLNNPKDAIPYLKKAIKLKPVNKSTVGNNASEDYDNLIAAYFILRDSVQYEKMILEKIKVKPAIDPAAGDYMLAGKACIDSKKYNDAENYFREALALDKANPDIYLSLALTQYLKDNYTGALENIEASYKLNDRKWEMYILYGIVSLCNNDPVNAFEAFKAARKLHNRKWIKEELMEKYFDLY